MFVKLLCSALIILQRWYKTILHSFQTKGTGPDSRRIILKSTASTSTVRFSAWLDAAPMPSMPWWTVDLSLANSIEAFRRNLSIFWTNSRRLERKIKCNNVLSESTTEHYRGNLQQRHVCLCFLCNLCSVLISLIPIGDVYECRHGYC